MIPITKADGRGRILLAASYLHCHIMKWCMLSAHSLAFRYYSAFICVCFFAFVKKKYWWITLIFFHAGSLYIRHMFQIHIYRAITLVCALAPPQETHMKARTDHFTLKLLVFLCWTMQHARNFWIPNSSTTRSCVSLLSSLLLKRNGTTPLQLQ